MCAFQVFITVDPSLGRLEYSLMSDQALMEMFIEKFDDETKKENQDKHGMYLDACEWECIECDDHERVVEIDIDSRSVSGTLDLCYVPPKVKVLEIRPPWLNGKLTGSVDLAHLPGEVQVVDLRGNALTGELDLTHLPKEMRILSIKHNQLSGEIDLTQLPKRMKQLILTVNQLTGGIDLTHLPGGMGHIYLSYNELSGEIDLTQLPKEMTILALCNNQFSGEINLTHLPHGMQNLILENNKLSGSFVMKAITNRMLTDAGGNKFNAVAVVVSKTRARIMLQGSGVTSVVDENGKAQDMKQFLR